MTARVLRVRVIHECPKMNMIPTSQVLKDIEGTNLVTFVRGIRQTVNQEQQIVHCFKVRGT